jgi:hypothetical protein
LRKVLDREKVKTALEFKGDDGKETERIGRLDASRIRKMSDDKG